MSAGDPPHFFSHLALRWEHRGDLVVGDATVSPQLCVPGTSTPRTSMLATYADNTAGMAAAIALGAVAPTLDLSIHVFRTPTAADLTLESRMLKAGRRVIVGETWFTAVGEPDPYAVAVTTFLGVGEPDPAALQLPTHEDPPFSPHQPLDEPIDVRAGIVVLAPGETQIEHRIHVSNHRGTVQGGMIALLAERACESLLSGLSGPGDRRADEQSADEQGGPAQVVTGMDLRYLAGLKVGPVRATATALRTDEAGAHLWVEVRDVGAADRLMVHAVATARPREALTPRDHRA